MFRMDDSHGFQKCCSSALWRAVGFLSRAFVCLCVLVGYGRLGRASLLQFMHLKVWHLSELVPLCRWQEETGTHRGIPNLPWMSDSLLITLLSINYSGSVTLPAQT